MDTRPYLSKIHVVCAFSLTMLVSFLGLSTNSWATSAIVPDCQNFNINRHIQRTGSKSYQCMVSAELSRSSQPDRQWIASLADPAIREVPFRSVVNLRAEDNSEALAVRANQMIAKHIPVPDLHAPMIAQIREFLDFVARAENQPVLVHCKAGQGRTGTFVTTYRIVVQNWPIAQALAEARAFNVSDEQYQFLQNFAQKWENGELEIAWNRPDGIILN